MHAPLTPQTRHVIGEAELRAMKSEAVLINTARGPLVDEYALARALSAGWIAGAGIDVLEAEPPPEGQPQGGTFMKDLHELIPNYRMPSVRKLSAGYFAMPQMDLIDLFIGAEGTLGVVTAVTLRVLPVRPALCLALVPFTDRRAALVFADRLRSTARDTWRGRSPRGIDVAVEQ